MFRIDANYTVTHFHLHHLYVHKHGIFIIHTVPNSKYKVYQCRDDSSTITVYCYGLSPLKNIIILQVDFQF